jgi:hypothetical protein
MSRGPDFQALPSPSWPQWAKQVAGGLKLGGSHHVRFKTKNDRIKNDRIQRKPVGERSRGAASHTAARHSAARLADGLPATARTAAVVGAGYQPNL